MVVGDTHVVLMLCFCSWYLFLVSVPGTFLLLSSFDIPLAIVPCNKVTPYCMPHGRPLPFLLVATPIPVAQLVYKAPVNTLYLLILNLLCISFLLLLTHPQALSLRLQPELLGHNTCPRYIITTALWHRQTITVIVMTWWYPVTPGYLKPPFSSCLPQQTTLLTQVVIYSTTKPLLNSELLYT